MHDIQNNKTTNGEVNINIESKNRQLHFLWGKFCSMNVKQKGQGDAKSMS